MNRLNPLNDYLFQKIMGEKGSEEQLLAFLNAVLKRTGKDNLLSVEILENKTITAEIIGNKTSILDIRSKLADGTYANIEVQLVNIGDMDRRSLFYWSREYSKAIKAGQTYSELPNVIAINIIDFEFIQIDDFHTSFHLWEDNNKDCLLTDVLEIHFIDMVKFRRLQHKDIQNNLLHRWLTFFDKNTKIDMLERVICMDTTIQKVHEKIEFLSNDAESLRMYEMREMAIFDFASGIKNAERTGEKIGEKKKAIEIALKSLKKGFSIEDIIEITELDESTVKQLQHELNP